MNQNESFGRRIRRLRVEKGYSQGDLAGRLYVTVQAVSRWETERGYPSIESVVNISVSPLLPSRCTYSSTVPVLEGKKGSGVCADAAACAKAAVESRIRNVFISIKVQSFSSSWKMSSVALPK